MIRSSAGRSRVPLTSVLACQCCPRQHTDKPSTACQWHPATLLPGLDQLRLEQRIDVPICNQTLGDEHDELDADLPAGVVPGLAMTGAVVLIPNLRGGVDVDLAGAAGLSVEQPQVAAYRRPNVL